MFDLFAMMSDPEAMTKVSAGFDQFVALLVSIDRHLYNIEAILLHDHGTMAHGITEHGDDPNDYHHLFVIAHPGEGSDDADAHHS